MRFYNSSSFAAALNSYTSAYAIWGTFAEAGDDGQACGGTEASDIASSTEDDALTAMMMGPAITPGDAAAKLQTYLDRNIWGWNNDDQPVNHITAVERVITDLREMARPGVSPDMAGHFEEWAAWRVAFQAIEDAADAGDGDLLDVPAYAHWNESSELAYRALMRCPCETPGDFIVKSYVQLREGEGGMRGGYTFLVRNPEDKEHDDGIGHGYAGLLRDIEQSDLGRCMLALGRIDFDADTWITNMIAVGHDFTVVIDGEERVFWQAVEGSPAGSEADARLFRMLSDLITQEPSRGERQRAIVDRLAEAYPEHACLVTKVEA